MYEVYFRYSESEDSAKSSEPEKQNKTKQKTIRGGGSRDQERHSISITGTGYLRQGERFTVVVEETGYGSWQN